MCGGFGSRLKNISRGVPKPLTKINNKTFLEILIKNFSRFKFKKILLLCHYKHNLFFKKFHKKTFDSSFIECIKEKKPLGTLGSLLNAKKKLDDFFLLSNGDTFFDINFFYFYNNFNYKKNLAIIAASQFNTNDKYRFQNIIIKKNKVEKLMLTKRRKQTTNSGICIINKSALKFSIKNNNSFDKDLLPKLVLKKKIQAILYKKKFIDIGTPKDLKYFRKHEDEIIRKSAVFLDRDGVLNYDYKYVYKIKDFVWKKNVIQAIKFLNDNNYLVFVISNQSGIGRGYYHYKDVEKLHEWINSELKKHGAKIDDFFYAPYHKDSNIKFSAKDKFLRKPNPGMVYLAKKKWKIDLNNSLIIGDANTDYKLAKKLKLKFIKVNDKSDLFNILKKYQKLRKL